MYPTDSKPGLFYDKAKVHKLKIGEGLEELTVILIISNIGTDTYEIVKYLNTSLTPLIKSQYNILNTDDFIQKIKSERIPERFKIIFFDVKSLFKNVLLDQTIEIIFSKVYQEKKIKTSIPEENITKLFYQCTKEVHFMFSNEIYIQNDGSCNMLPIRTITRKHFISS